MYINIVYLCINWIYYIFLQHCTTDETVVGEKKKVWLTRNITLLRNVLSFLKTCNYDSLCLDSWVVSRFILSVLRCMSMILLGHYPRQNLDKMSRTSENHSDNYYHWIYRWLDYWIICPPLLIRGICNFVICKFKSSFLFLASEEIPLP